MSTKGLDHDPHTRNFVKSAAIASIAVATVATLVYLVLRPANDVATRSTTELPEFSLPYLNEDGSLTSDSLQGRPLVINFWASWCAPCIEEAPLLERMWRRYRDDGVVFVGVNVQDTEDAARAFVNRFDLTFPMVRDADRTLLRALSDIDFLPQTFFITRDGHVLASATSPITEIGGRPTLGAIDADELEAQIRALVA
ncbi:MAG: TlpA family protein disulfide reductase, partial [Actinomycetota bacterium]|nr:TlpA family protein disulfide reductase [Actinomycetota bacterium]